MATRIVSSAVEQHKLAVVPFPAPQAVTQLELAALLSLRARLHQLEEQVEAAEASIKNRLETGASLEPGDHTAELKESFRRNVSWKDVATRLADRLYFGKGMNYVESILRKTKPTRTVSLALSKPKREGGLSARPRVCGICAPCRRTEEEARRWRMR